MRTTKTAVAALLVAAMVPCAAFAQPVGEVDSALSCAPASVDVLVAPDEEQSTVLVEAETIGAESTLAADDAEVRAYVSRLYQLVMDREPDTAGLAVQVEGVVAGFANSEEFRSNCAEWGVNPGTVSITHGWCEVNLNGQVLVSDPDLYYELGIQCYMVPFGSTPKELHR